MNSKSRCPEFKLRLCAIALCSYIFAKSIKKLLVGIQFLLEYFCFILLFSFDTVLLFQKCDLLLDCPLNRKKVANTVIATPRTAPMIVSGNSRLSTNDAATTAMPTMAIANAILHHFSRKVCLEVSAIVKIVHRGLPLVGDNSWLIREKRRNLYLLPSYK